jgi:hypothetical protein
VLEHPAHAIPNTIMNVAFMSLQAYPHFPCIARENPAKSPKAFAIRHPDGNIKTERKKIWGEIWLYMYIPTIYD